MWCSSMTEFLEWFTLRKHVVVSYMRELFSICFLLYCPNGGNLLLTSTRLPTVVPPCALAICGDPGPVKGVSDTYKIGNGPSQ